MRRFLWAVVLVFLVGCSGAGSSSSEAESGHKVSLEQQFTLKDVRGQDVSLQSLLKTNKAVLLNFWATWCPYCREEISSLIQLQDKYQDKGFTVVGIDEAESARKVSAYMEKKGMNYPVLLDEDGEVAARFGVVGIPTSVLIRSNGQITGVFSALDRKAYAEIEKALA